MSTLHGTVRPARVGHPRELVAFTAQARESGTNTAALYRIRDRETTEGVVPYLHPLLGTAVV
jgi:hypothetical protein